MTDNIVASVPLGLFLTGGILLLLTGLIFGWLITTRRTKRNFQQGMLDLRGHAEALLNSLPQAALLANAEGQIIVQNARAVQTIREYHQQNDKTQQNGLPQAITAAVSRTLGSGIAEMLELPSPVPAGRRMQILVTPLSTGETYSEALALFIDPLISTDRGDISQRLAQTLAHEIRTPLTAIMGHVEILNSCGIDEEALWRRSLGFVSSETERLARLVEDMLYLSRLERAPLDMQPVNLRLIAEEAISNLYEQAEKNKVTLVLQSPSNLPRAHADSDRIRQVFINLLDNAIKYAPGGTITISLAVEQGLVLVRIQDTGPGVSVEDLPHIFEPFYRSEKTAVRERGTGLGLTIVQTILDQHYSPIKVKNNPSEGSVFTFSLPTDR